jgi:hypothetical protein
VEKPISILPKLLWGLNICLFIIFFYSTNLSLLRKKKRCRRLFLLPVVQDLGALNTSPTRIAIAVVTCVGGSRDNAEAIATRRDLAVLTGVAARTRARIGVDAVDARGIVGAHIAEAVVDLGLAVLASEAGGAAATLVGAGAPVIAAAVRQQVVGTLGVYDGRDGLGRAELADPVRFANAIAVLVTAVVA